MKLFSKKEEKNKVGRPRLADTDTKKKALIMCTSSLLLVVALLAGSLVTLNILPNFNKLKGNVSLCTEIPARFKSYNAETNPDGLHEYGFTDPKFYSVVVASYNSNSTYCSTITEEQLASITSLYAYNSGLTNADGIEYLTGLTTLDLSSNNLSSIDVSKNTALTSLTLGHNNLSSIDLSSNTALRELGLYNNNLSSIDVSNNTALYHLELLNNNLSSIDLDGLISLEWLFLSDNNLSGTLDLSTNTSISLVYLNNNNLNEVILGNNENLSELILHNNNLKNIDLSGVPNLMGITLQNNPLTNTIYMLKDSIVNYNENIKLKEGLEVTYGVDDLEVALYEDGKLKALKEGTTIVKMLNENIISILPEYMEKCFSDFDYANNQEYCDSFGDDGYILPYFMSNEIKVYDIKSDTYKIDKNNKTIDVKGTNLDVSKITLTLDGLTGAIENDNYVIKDDGVVVDKYIILNQKVDKEETTTTIPTTKKEEVSTTKSTSTTKKEVTSNTTTKKEETNIELSTSVVSSELLESIKGQDKNIVVKQDNITFTINGKDIENIDGNLDLSVEIEDLKESILNEEIKEKIENAVVLNFKNEGELPGKLLVEVNVTEDIKKNIGEKDINVYNYNKDKYNLIAEDLSLNENKLKFYVDKLGYYVLTNNKIEDKNVEIDDSMMGENTKLNKEINYNKVIISIVIVVIIITLGIIGYVRYKKNKK